MVLYSVIRLCIHTFIRVVVSVISVTCINGFSPNVANARVYLGTKMNRLHFGARRSKVKVAVGGVTLRLELCIKF